MDGNFFAESLKGISTLELLKFLGSVLVQKFIDREVTASDLNHDLVSGNFDVDATRAEFVDTLLFSHEHDLKFLAVGVVVDILSQLFVDGAVLCWNVDGDTCFQVNNVRLQSLNFYLPISQIRQQVQRSLVRLVHFVFKLGHILSGVDHLALQKCLCCLAFAKLGAQLTVFLAQHLIVSLEVSNDIIVLPNDLFTALYMGLFDLFLNKAFLYRFT